MRSRTRFLIDHVLPPVLKERMAWVLHRLRGDATVFEGDFASWADAERRTDGYDAAAILERTRQAVLKAKDDPEVFERDSVILPKAEYSFPVLAALLWLALRRDSRLDVVDFGGSLGSSFFQLRPFLKDIPNLRWAVVEQPHYVECGKVEFAGNGLSFHTTIEDALCDLRPDVLLISSVFQYLPAPHLALRQMITHGFTYLLLDRTAFHTGARDRLTIQKNPASIYPASYPAWFFSEESFCDTFREDYRVVFDFPGVDRALVAGTRPYHRGYLLERRGSPEVAR
jgi:putative methyltransferase (TIGR04325 family)